ncbi:MAG: nitrilase family protein [Paludibacteraceae bacterium]|nr:nitrilase family protein [Paludibacteraceae bacterium]
MRIALLQYPIDWGDIDTNLRLTERRIEALQGKADVALLPEMFTTGFCTDRPELAEDMHGLTVQSLLRWAKTFDLAVAGSFMAADEGNLYNRGFFVMPDGNAVYADKRHLYAHGGEASFFTAGTQRPVVTFRGCRFCLQVCYDLRFPVWSRNRSGNDYDILLYTANWPECRIQYWDALVPARATENQCYVCAVNRVGDDGLGLHYNGHSMALDTRLKPLAAFADDEAGTRIARFDLEALRHFRQTLPLWRDADPFEFVDS